MARGARLVRRDLCTALSLCAAFVGIDASGRWRLIVTDDNANDTGTLNDWSLRILY